MPRVLAKEDQQSGAAFDLATNLFGPQSQWSSLLSQREHLLHEIKRDRKYLDQICKDLPECSALVKSWPTMEGAGANGWVPRLVLPSAANDGMEQFLLRWLERLEERLSMVSLELDSVKVPGIPEPPNSNETTDDLLRAAG